MFWRLEKKMLLKDFFSKLHIPKKTFKCWLFIASHKNLMVSGIISSDQVLLPQKLKILASLYTLKHAGELSDILNE